MAREVESWITVNGQHIPIFKGESKQDAVNRAIANKNEDTKEKQIAKAKEQADKLNGKDVITHEHPKNQQSTKVTVKKKKPTPEEVANLKKLYEQVQIAKEDLKDIDGDDAREQWKEKIKRLTKKYQDEWNRLYD